MALEDAVVFGQLFRHLSSEDQIPRFLNAYEELRQERTAQVLEREISNTEMVTMPPGPERDARDASFKQTRDKWDEGLLKAEFEGLFDLFGYDAYDAAEVCVLFVIVPITLLMTCRRSNGGWIGVATMASLPSPIPSCPSCSSHSRIPL